MTAYFYLSKPFTHVYVTSCQLSGKIDMDFT